MGPSAEKQQTTDAIVGIDLGTTNSLVAYYSPERNAAPAILTDAQGRAMLPSVVRFDGGGSPIALGYEARRDSLTHPLSTVSSVKRLMGRSIEDAGEDLAFLSYRVVAGPNNTARVALPLADGSTKVVSPQEVSAIVLRALKTQAEARLGVQVHKAVVTVPAYFDDAQRQATRDAGRLAGLEVVRIINEPTAAALAYGLGLRHAGGAESRSRVVAIYDLGGGTFDVSILRITPGTSGEAAADTPATVSDYFQVLSTSGDTHLGGDDFDHALVGLFTAEINGQFGRGHGAGKETLTFSPETQQALLQFAEAAKIRLSSEMSVAIKIDLGSVGVYSRTITWDEFERLISPLVERTLESCSRALRDARKQLAGEEIEAVVMVGGSTRVPLVRRRVEEFFKITPYTALDPDQVVALGAAMQAHVLSSRGSGSGVPKSLLLDVVPLSLGIETVGGAMAKLIMRNSGVPSRAKEMFSTSVDNQTAFQLNVLQGEREMAADCRLLGRFELKGIPPMPAGIPQLQVEFAVDASGILTVHASELRSGKRLQAQVVPNHGLTQGEVERIEKESFTNARADMQQHRVVDLVTNAKLDAHWISRQLERVGTDVPKDVRADVEAKLAMLREFIAKATSDHRSVDANAFHAAKEALDASSVRLHEIAIARSLRGDP